MKRIAIDTNVVDKIADKPKLLEAVQEAGARGALRLIATHVQRDELAAIADGERRARLLAVYDALPLEEIATRHFVIDRSRLGMARLGDGEEYARYLGQGGATKHAPDALIALTASRDADVLVTCDGKTKRNGMVQRMHRDFPTFPVWGIEEFEAFVSATPDRQ